MIFGNLFKPKWLHKDSTVRIEAVETVLNCDSTDDVKALKSIVESDDNDLVRRAALLKLNTFEDWFNASQSNNNKKTKSFAKAKVEDIVFGRDTITLTVKQKFALLDNVLKQSFIEAWLKVEDDPNLIITLFEKLEKPQLKIKVFVDKPLEAVQIYLVDSTDDVSTLEKMLKKAGSEQVSRVIQQRIAGIEESLNKPKVVGKRAQLVLSKLLALRDESNYELMLKKRDVIESDWHAIKEDFSCIENGEELTQKYTDISDQLAKLFAQKAEAYEQEKIAHKLEAQKKQQLTQFSQTLDALQGKITDAIFENVTLNVIEEKRLLDEFADDVNNSILNASDKDKLVKQSKKYQIKLDNLSDIASSVTQATHLIAKASQLSYPNELSDLNDKWQQFEEWQKQWRAVVDIAKGYLPQAVMDAQQQIEKEWLTKTAPFKKEQQKLFHATKKKFSDINRLINSGKYNAVFGVFKNASSQFSLLSIKHQKLLQKEFDKHSDKVKELSDWEHYVATPRKEKLLSDIQLLAETPLDSPLKQSERVKEFRKTWNSLGHADDSLESSLNEAFNEACEKAFEPCRLYFAEQEKIREKNLKIKEAIIEDAKKLAASVVESIDGKELDAGLSKLRQRWRQSGDVDRKRYLSCKNEFDAAIGPIKDKVNQFHTENASAKKRLIKEAESALAMDDVFQATNDVKALQKQWSTIGYSGVKDENQLWKEFRKVNDLVFAKRNEAKQQESSELEANITKWRTSVDSILSPSENKDKKWLRHSIQQLEELSAEIKQTKQGVKSLVAEIQNAIDEMKAQMDVLKLAEDKSHWENLFVLLKSINSSEESLNDSALFEKLPVNWQKKLSQVNKLTEQEIDVEKRQEQLIKLEVLAGVDSPESLKQERMRVQVAVMQEQMTSSESIDLTQMLFDWLALGRLTEIDENDLSRLQKIYEYS